MNKVLICPFFGPRPPWMHSYWENAEKYLKPQGYDFLLDDDEDAFRDRVRERLGIVCPPMWGNGNIWDFRPALGFLYAQETRDYDFWGHTDFDCVFGRIQNFYPDSLLDRYDILSDHWDYIAGPWTLYRNTPAVNKLFFENDEWMAVMRSQTPVGWPEFGYATTAKGSGLRVRLKCSHAWYSPELLAFDGDALLFDGREVPFFHFRHTKEWPL